MVRPASVRLLQTVRRSTCPMPRRCLVRRASADRCDTTEREPAATCRRRRATVDRAPTTAWTNRRRECGDWSRSGAPNPHPGVAALHEAVGARSDRTVPCARVPRRRADHPRAPPAMELPRNRERAVLQRRSSRTRRQSEVRCGARTVSKATAVVDRCRRSRRGTERSGRCRRRRHRR